jgi:hypothetical protein
MLQQDKYKKFWEQFSAFSNELYKTDELSEEMLYKLVHTLWAVHPQLVFELGPPADKRELIISANGIKDVFPEVLELIKVAPVFDNWQIIPFRQRKGDDVGVQIEEMTLSVTDILFHHVWEGNKLGLILYIKDKPIIDKIYYAVFMLLDGLLGEYDVETKIGSIAIKSLDEVENSEDLEPLQVLPQIVDSHFAKRVD